MSSKAALIPLGLMWLKIIWINQADSWIYINNIYMPHEVFLDLTEVKTLQNTHNPKINE